jgi:hypothetical protein
MHIANIVVRLVIVVVGVLLIFSVPPFAGLSSPLQEVCGIVVTLFGVLRLTMYLSKHRTQP